MQIAQKLAGYSLASADSLRRAMGKKIRAEMETHRKTFIDGATSRGISEAKAGEIFDLMAKFADYGFNKSHAAAYALVTYQTAWMRANHPAVFLAACMSLAINNTDRLAALRQEAGQLDIPVLPPDINRSEADFTVERQPDGALVIRYALAAVKKVGLAAMQALVASRGNRPFADLADFAARIDPRQLNRMQLENLTRAGAFDALFGNRARLHAGAEALLRSAQAAQEERASGQIGLFGGATTAAAPRLPDIADWPPMERLGFEAEAIGFHLTAHPLDAYAKVLRRLGVVPSNQLSSRAAAGAVRLRLAGSVVGCKQRLARSGSPMAWLRLSDGGGSYEVTLFSEVLTRSRDMLQEGNTVLVTAEIRLEGETLRITAQEIAPLDQVAADAAAGIRIWLERTEAVPHIRAILGSDKAGKGRVVLIPRLGTLQEVEITLPGGFNVTPRVTQALQTVPGVERVEET